MCEMDDQNMMDRVIHVDVTYADVAEGYKFGILAFCYALLTTLILLGLGMQSMSGASSNELIHLGMISEIFNGDCQLG